jgi:1,2-diacylglycerol-3-alpha-glucose alpha-1,2-glucosyltransferase
MKVLLYTEGLKTIGKSGLGKAIKHQINALEDNNIDYTTNIKDDFDILHVNFYGPKSYFFTKKAKKMGKKIVYHAHSTEEDFKNSFILSNLISPLFKWWICKCYKMGDHILTPTPYSKKLLESYNKFDVPITDISNGINIEFFKHNDKLGKEFRKKFGYKDTDKIIMGVGLYIERKGILDFVELAKRLPEYKFIWFGYSPLIFSPLKIRRAVKTKLDNLTFAGYVEPDILKGAYSGCDLYLFPTLEETEGIPIMEACAAKIPALIRDIPVFDGWLEDGKNVYKAKDLDEFEIKIKGIIEGKLKDLTKEGYKVAQERDIKKVGKKLVSIYKELDGGNNA